MDKETALHAIMLSELPHIGEKQRHAFWPAISGAITALPHSSACRRRGCARTTNCTGHDRPTLFGAAGTRSPLRMAA